LLKEYNTDMTVEQFTEESGISIDEILNKSDVEDIVDELIEEYTYEGVYKTYKGKLYMAQDVRESDKVIIDIEKSAYSEYAVEKDTLILTGDYNADGTPVDDKAATITLKKIK